MSYQEGKIVLYGQGKQPKISTEENKKTIKIEDGVWIIRSLDQSQKIDINASSTQVTLQGVGGVFLDINQKLIANFDADITV